MRLTDKYKGIKEQGVIAVLQKPGEKPLKLDLKKGWSPNVTSDLKTDENTPNDK